MAIQQGASMMGTIANLLNTLHGIGVMSLELIQNAEDSKSSYIEFDIDDDALRISNGAYFRHCGEKDRECSNDAACDWHRVAFINANAKGKYETDSIGRFGIGFVSVYQVTDTPIIRSGAHSMTLDPSKNLTELEDKEFFEGTQITLPYALDPNTKFRSFLGSIGIFDISRLDEYGEIISKSAEKSLYFLKNVSQITIKRNGRLIFKVDINYTSANRKKITISNKSEVLQEQEWLILSKINSSFLDEIEKKYPILKNDKRKKLVQICLPINMSKDFSTGFLYAFLPTEQAIEIPFHINGDFFPLSDRKTVHLPGVEGEYAKAAWNVAIIESAASLLNENMIQIYKEIGAYSFWSIISKAESIHQNNAVNKQPFHIFWEMFHKSVPNQEIVLDDQEFSRKPEKVFVVRGDKIGLKREVLTFLRLPHLHTSLTDFARVIEMCSGRTLELESFILAARSSNVFKDELPSEPLSKEVRERRHLPFLELLNSLAKNPDQFLEIIRKYPQLDHWPILLDEKNNLTSISRAKLLPPDIDAVAISIIDPTLNLLNQDMGIYGNLIGAFQKFTAVDLLNLISNISQKGILAEQTNKNLMEAVHISILQFHTYKLFKSEDLDQIRFLKIWPGSPKHYYSARECKIPGDFSDPLNLAQLINPKLFMQSALEFLSKILGVSKLSLDTYIAEILPKYFSGEVNNISAENYQKLLIELWRDQTALTIGSGLNAFKNMYIIPIGGNSYCKPQDACFFDPEIQKLIGNVGFNWVAEDLMPKGLEFKGIFLRWGVKERPGISELCGAWKTIVKSGSPSQERAKINDIANYIHLNFRKFEANEATNQLSLLISDRCVPANGDSDNWYRPTELYLNRYKELFSSQPQSHSIGLSAKDPKKTFDFDEFLVKRLSVKFAPELQLVISHLAWAKNSGNNPTKVLFIFLNEIAKGNGRDGELSSLKLLRNQPILYFSDFGYIAPQQLFKSAGPIPKPWAFSLNEEDLKQFKELWEAFNIPDSPQSSDVVETIREIKGHLGWRTPETRESLRVAYERCWTALNSHAELNTLDTRTLNALINEPLILTRTNEFKTSRQIFIQDSEWFEEILGDKFGSHIAFCIDSSQKLYELLELDEASTQLVASLSKVEGARLRNYPLETKLHKRAKYLELVLGNDSLYPWAQTLSNVSVQTVDELTIKWSLKTKYGSSQSAIVGSMKVFLDIPNRILYVVKTKSEFSLTRFFRDLLHQLLPQIPEEQLRTLTGTLDNVMNREENSIQSFLVDLGYEFESKTKSENQELNQDAISSPDGQISHLGEWITADAADSPAEGLSEARNEEIDSIGLEHSYGIRVPNAHSESSSLGKRNPYQSGIGEGAGGSKTSTSKPNPPTQSEIRRVWVYVDGKSTESGQVEHSEKMKIEEKSLEKVEAEEWREGRKPHVMPPRNPGYDIRSIEPDDRIRYIEVKATRGAWGARGVSMTPAQIKFAIGKGNSYWVYVVEFAESENPTIHRIQNPALYTAGYRLNDSWREFAEMQRGEGYIDDPDVLTISDSGRPFLHKQFGRGWIHDVWEEEDGLLATVRYESKDEPEKEPLLWDAELMHKLDT